MKSSDIRTDKIWELHFRSSMCAKGHTEHTACLACSTPVRSQNHPAKWQGHKRSEEQVYASCQVANMGLKSYGSNSRPCDFHPSTLLPLYRWALAWLSEGQGDRAKQSPFQVHETQGRTAYKAIMLIFLAGSHHTLGLVLGPVTTHRPTAGWSELKRIVSQDAPAWWEEWGLQASETGAA